VKQEEPLKIECQHFLDCIATGATPISNGQQGLELVKILEASSKSLKANGAPVFLNDEVSEHSRPVIQIRPAAPRSVNGNGNGHRPRAVRVA
jgi:hypothetical protein